MQESHKRAKNEKREPLDEDQLFVVDLARDLSRVCQVQSTLICTNRTDLSLNPELYYQIQRFQNGAQGDTKMNAKVFVCSGIVRLSLELHLLNRIIVTYLII